MTRPDLLMPAEVAALFHVSAKTVTRWAATGKLPAQRTLGGHRRYLRADVLAAMARAQASDLTNGGAGDAAPATASRAPRRLQ